MVEMRWDWCNRPPSDGIGKMEINVDTKFYLRVFYQREVSAKNLPLCEGIAAPRCAAFAHLSPLGE
jgi:hypothetical protein